MTAYLGWTIDAWAAKTGREPSEKYFEALSWKMYQNSRIQSGGDYLLAWQDVQKMLLLLFQDEMRRNQRD